MLDGAWSGIRECVVSEDEQSAGAEGLPDGLAGAFHIIGVIQTETEVTVEDNAVEGVHWEVLVDFSAGSNDMLGGSVGSERWIDF